MKEVTFSGRWHREKECGKHRKSYSLSIKSSPLVIVLAVAGIMVFLISTAFAASISSQVQVDQLSDTDSIESGNDADWAVDSESDGYGEPSEYEQMWAGHIRDLSRQQQEDQARIQAEKEIQLQAQEGAARIEAERRQLEQSIASKSLSIGTFTNEPGTDEVMAKAIDLYLSDRGSPMEGYGEVFVSAGKIFGVDPYLVVAIAGKESSWGKYCFKPFNAWGWGDEEWSDFNDAIINYTRNLSVEYISKGIDTIPQIAPIYCPPNYISWTEDVTLFYSELVTLQKTVQ